MAIIKTLKTTTNDVEQSVYPKTVLEAVVDAETNETLDVILDNLNEKIDNIEPGGGGGGGTTYELSRTEDTITLTGSDGSSSEITDSSAYLSRENLLVYPYHDNTSTIYGVTFTVNNDGTITANGESTSSYSAFSISTRHADSNPLIVLPKGTYTLSGCPTGGGETTYCIQIGIDSNGSWKTIATDTGNGAIFTLTEETQIAINCPIMSGVTVENLIFKPMLEVGTVAHEYQPYNLSRQKLRSDLDSINTDLDTSDKVSKSGDTMTGDLTVKANINTPLLSDNSDTTIVTVPTAGTVNIGSTDKGITDVLTSYKSFIGSIHTKDAWNSVISVRHRNGVHDGSSHGMYLRSLMNTGNTNLIWNNQNAGTWESERTILDSRNYSSYALPLTGGKITGGLTVTDGFYSTGEQTVLYQDYYCFHTQDGAGKTGYWKLCTINVTGTYAGAIIEFDMTCRYGRGKLYLSFGGTSTDISAYTVSIFKQTGGLRQCYAVKTSGTSSGSVFDIYVQKEEAWGNLTVNHMKFPNYMRGLMTLTWSGAYASSVPTTNRSEAQVGNDWTTAGTVTGKSLSLSLNKGSAYILFMMPNNGMTFMLTFISNSNETFAGGLMINHGSATYSVSGTTVTVVVDGTTDSSIINYKLLELK